LLAPCSNLGSKRNLGLINNLRPGRFMQTQNANSVGGSRRASPLKPASRSTPLNISLTAHATVIAMAYGDRPEFNVALAYVGALAEQAVQHEGNGAC
jgi:hypothetical protein